MIRRYSLLAPLAVLFAALAAVSVYSGYMLFAPAVRNWHRAEEIDHARTIRAALEADLRAEVRSLRVVGRALVNDRLLGDAVYAYQRDPGSAARFAQLRALMDAIYRRAEVSMFGIIDRNGKAIYRAHSPGVAGDSPTDWGIAEALRGSESVASEMGRDGVRIVKVVPVRHGDAVVAALQVGIQLDDRFAQKVATQFGAALSFVHKERVFASSLPEAERGQIDLDAVRSSLRERTAVYQHDSARQRTTIYDPQQLVDETVVVVVHLDKKASFARVDEAMLRLTYLLVSIGIVIALLATLAVYFLVVRRLDVLRKIAEETSHFMPGTDEPGSMPRNEIDALSASFHRMRDGLLESKNLLESRVEDRTRELSYLAGHDPLTGLANRTAYQQFLETAIKSARRRGVKVALLLMDLDGFKEVNDSLGHDQGDRLLQDVARRIQGLVREVDLVARFGGDEFCLLLVDIEGIRQAVEVAERCLKVLNAPISLNGKAVRTRASIGIACYPDAAQAPADLLKAADTAMYSAKQAGKHRYTVYETAMTKDLERQLALEEALREALERNEFELHYQPQVSLQDGRMHGVEALIRWRHPERGLVPPDEFIPVLEQIGLIGAIGVWVLETACRQSVAWRKDGVQSLLVAVNISPSHFIAPGFVDTVSRVLQDTGLAPNRLEIEVTESVTRDPVELAAVCADLKRLGVRVSLDDFGTGYSSLSVLKKMPIDTLKLDRQFIHGILDDPQSAVMIGTIIGMAHGLKCVTVAEGVETLQEVHVLKAIGCVLAQGYYFSRPVTADRVPELAHKDFINHVVAGHAESALVRAA